MTTFAQWRSPSTRTGLSGPIGPLRKYDTRLLDQFYVYCQATSRADALRESAVQTERAMKRRLWAALIAGSVLGYYLVERVAQAMSLY